MRSLLAALLLAAPAPLMGEDLPIPPAPVDGIYDDARLLDDASRAELRGIVTELKTKSNVDLFVAAYTLLPGDIDEHARRLRAKWVPDSRGMVVVYRRGTQQLAFSSNEEAEAFIPPANLYTICNDAVSAALTREDPRDRIVAAVGTLARGITKDLAKRDQPRDGVSPSVLKLIAGLVAVVLVIAGIAFYIVSRLAQRRRESETAIRFPDVVVGERLGAPFGGGTVAEADYEKAPINGAGALPPPGH